MSYKSAIPFAMYVLERGTQFKTSNGQRELEQEAIAKLEALRDAVPDDLPEIVRISELGIDEFNETMPDNYTQVLEDTARLIHQATEIDDGKD